MFTSDINQETSEKEDKHLITNNNSITVLITEPKIKKSEKQEPNKL